MEKVILKYKDGSMRIASFINNKYYVYLTNFELNINNVENIINI